MGLSGTERGTNRAPRVAGAAATDAGGPGAARRRGRPAWLSRELVIDAGVRVARARGLDAVGIRAVAEKLGSSPVGLYGYVADKQQLVDLVIDAIIDGHDLGHSWPDGWEDLLVAFATRLRDLILTEPVLLDVYGRGEPVVVPSALAVVELILNRLTAAGLAPGDAVDTYVAAHSLATAHAARLHQRRVADRTRRRRSPAQVDQLRTLITADPIDRPTLASAVDEVANAYRDDHFRSALGLIIDGARARMAQ